MKNVYMSLLLFLYTHSENLHFDGSQSDFDPNDNRFVVQPFTKPQINCMILKSNLTAYPIFKETNFGLKSFFKRKPLRTFKSFRSIAFDIIKSAVFSSEEIRQNNLQDFTAKFEDLEQKKMDNLKLDLQLTNNRSSSSQKKALKISKDLAKLERLLESKQLPRQKQMVEVNRLIGVLKGNILKWDDQELNALIAGLDNLTSLKDRIDLPFQDDQFLTTVNQVSSENVSLSDLGSIAAGYVSLKEQIEHWKGLQEMVGLYGDILSSFETQDPVPLTFESVEHDLDSLAKILADLQKAKDRHAKSFKDLLDTQAKAYKQEIKKHPVYLEFVDYVNQYKGAKKVLESMEGEVEKLAFQIQDLKQKLEHLQVKSDATYTLPRDSGVIVEENISLLERSTQFFSQEIPLPQNNKHFKKYDALFKKYGQLIPDPEYSRKNDSLLKQKLEKISEIQSIESELDTFLGKLFAQLQYHGDGRVCFSLAELSYLIFSLVKTNAVVNESAFLTGLFSKMGYPDVKEFVIHNYGLFASKEFIDRQFTLDDFKPELPNQKRRSRLMLMDVYIKNWSFLVSAFKEYTQFGVEWEKKGLDTVGVGRRLSYSIKTSLISLFKLQKDASFGEIHTQLIQELWKLIPFVGNIPFLTTLLVTMLVNITNFIIHLITKHYGLDEAKTRGLFQKINLFFKHLKKKSVYSLDYKDHLRDQTGDSDPDPWESQSGAVDIDLHVIEKIYSDSVSIGGEDRFVLFDPQENSLNVKRMVDETVYTDVRALYEQAKLPDFNMKQFVGLRALKNQLDLDADEEAQQQEKLTIQSEMKRYFEETWETKHRYKSKESIPFENPDAFKVRQSREKPKALNLDSSPGNRPEVHGLSANTQSELEFSDITVLRYTEDEPYFDALSSQDSDDDFVNISMPSEESGNGSIQNERLVML